MAVTATISHGEGWYEEERDGARPFRWMGRQARCRITGVPSSGTAYLRVTAGHGWPAGSWPVLTVSISGQVAGQRTIRPHFSDCLFPIGQAGDADLVLELDRAQAAPGDTRVLGVMVSSIDVIDVNGLDAAVPAEGWYEQEFGEYFPFRWMGLEARLIVPAPLCAGRRFAALPVSADFPDGSHALTVSAGTDVVAVLPLLERWHVYEFALPGGSAALAPETPHGPLELTLRVDALLPADFHPSDWRDLAIRAGSLDLHDDARRYEKACALHQAEHAGSTVSGSVTVERVGSGTEPASPARYLPQDGEGWDRWELQDYLPFRWMRLEARLTISASVHRGRRFCTLPIFSEFHDLSQVMTITANGRAVMHLGLARYWNYYTFEVPASRDDDVALTFRLNKALPSSYHPDDSRIDLGARVGAFEFHDDELRRQRTEALHENAVLNRAELEAGSTVLASFPLNLGIDLYGKCNIKPPCVYCWWDQCKSLEGEDVNAIVDDRTLLEYGPFFDAAQSLINCSFGEPLLHPRLAEIARLLGTRDKVAEIATNGQAFTPATVGALAGQPILLYISLDAASPEVYGRLRNDRWHEVVAGLTFLREARRRANGLPKVRMVFMPMRANLGDLEAYFRLCRMVEAEALVLRPLNYAENTSIRAERGGYQFDYERELLNREEIEAVCRRAEEYAERYGLWLISQFDFGAPKRPRVRGAHREGSSHGDSAA